VRKLAARNLPEFAYETFASGKTRRRCGCYSPMAGKFHNEAEALLKRSGKGD
jgi:hypothetical protein